MKTSHCFKNIFVILFFSVAFGCFAKSADLTEAMKDSVVYLEISSSSYSQAQPWKRSPITKNTGSGCAVGPYEVLTTADNVINATLVQIKRYGNNAYIPATVKIVDYELNLCLLELDKEATGTPLKPLSFKEAYPKGKQLTAYWLSSSDHMTTARSTLDRAEMESSSISFVKNLTYFATNVSRPFGDGEACCDGKNVIGMGCWGTDSDSGIIPSETINKFLRSYNKGGYAGFATPGFKTYALLDPVMRRYLKLPEQIQHGVYVSTVYTMGTGSSALKPADVILSIDGHRLNPYGRYEHPRYNRISFHHLLLQTPVGKTMKYEVFRDGKTITLDIAAAGVESDKMLIPRYIYGKQPEYMVVGGFVLQRLTRDYLAMQGSGWRGSAPPHLYSYYRDKSFKPSNDRKQIVILSYVLPTQANFGYHRLSGLVVDSVNGTNISSIADIRRVINGLDDTANIEISFEMDSPAVIIPKKNLSLADMQVSQAYGIPKLINIDE